MEKHKRLKREIEGETETERNRERETEREREIKTDLEKHKGFNRLLFTRTKT